MKKAVLFLLLALGVGITVNSLIPPRYAGDFNVDDFADLPVLAGGRVKPMDSVARSALMIMHGRQSLEIEDGRSLSAVEWLMDVTMDFETAKEYRIFRIDHDEVLGLFGWEQEDRKHFSFQELMPHLEEIENQARIAQPVEPQLRSAFQRQIVQLSQVLFLHHRLMQSLHSADTENIEAELADYQGVIGPGREAFLLREQGQAFDEEVLERFVTYADRYQRLSQTAYLAAVPPSDPSGDPDDWKNVGTRLLDSIRNEELDPVVGGYVRMIGAYKDGNPQLFNAEVRQLKQTLHERLPAGGVSRLTYEYRFFNSVQPFYQAMGLYVLIFLVVCFSWLGWSKTLGKAAFWLIVLAFLIHSFGMISRMYLQGRPPVTNLYSSAVFVGWGAVLLGILLERFYKNGIGSMVAAGVGFLTLLVAHHLSVDGDTMEMMVAVLDSNFWLATHVVVITIGYAATFLAGFLAILYILRGVFSRGLDVKTGKSMTRMVYGILCFGLLFSFVGTILGGIWADQSWGRFWGWDPKENGALIIVLWNALILHARWGGLVWDRGIMVLAVFGNVVTSWSWFGTNMLGIGLHSYGFMDAAFFWLMFFVGTQLSIMAIGSLPPRLWRSPVMRVSSKGKKSES